MVSRQRINRRGYRLWRERRKSDRECTVEQEVDMLEKCGYRIVKCVDSYQKFSVIAAIR